jgi:phage terminase Nu1 subunit (DNA packaging protein)
MGWPALDRGVLMAIVGVGKVAAFLNLSEQRVQQLVKDGLPRERRGEYDPIKCGMWYIRYLQHLLEKNAVPTLDGGFVGERAERLRLLRAVADIREMELAQVRSQQVAIQDVEREMNDLILTSTAVIMAVAPRLATDLVGENSRLIIHGKIEKALKGALLILSKRESRTGKAL